MVKWILWNSGWAWGTSRSLLRREKEIIPNKRGLLGVGGVALRADQQGHKRRSAHRELWVEGRPQGRWLWSQMWGQRVRSRQKSGWRQFLSTFAWLLKVHSWKAVRRLTPPKLQACLGVTPKGTNVCQGKGTWVTQIQFSELSLLQFKIYV